MKLVDACALITGGASGLDNAVAKHIIGAGGTVAILDVQDTAGNDAAKVLGSRAIFVKCDVTDEKNVDAAVQSARDFMGSINLAVNCAGVVGAGRMLGKTGPMDGNFFIKVIHINLVGTFLIDKACA